ncbi:hypothetical protein RMATCC62417_13310 [Rhizopus microsporus]|nr:hypothetical protein RMATCC62417_13310 [Rhizopus microsporus]
MAGDVRQITRKCKLSSLLNQPYKQHRQEVRKIAEEYSILRRGAMNLVLYCICFWVENGFREDTTYPDVMSRKFWNHCYCTVACSEGHVPRSGFIECVRDRFDIFDICRKNPDNSQYLYDIPVLDALHGYLASLYTTSVITSKPE